MIFIHLMNNAPTLGTLSFPIPDLLIFPSQTCPHRKYFKNNCSIFPVFYVSISESRYFMARTARLFVENACYHIITRGNKRDVVFKNDADFETFLFFLHRYKIKFGCLIYGYCLMPNHVHLILESPRGLTAMSSFMKGINQTYAMKFNSKYNQVGHLWQNRYKNYVVLKDEYLLNLISYVHYNPVRKKIVRRPEDYAWSSYRAVVLGEKNAIVDQLHI